VSQVRKARERVAKTRNLRAIGAALDRVMATCDVPARLAIDPVSIVHRYQHRSDRELVGLLASAVAFGNVKAFRVKLEQALARLGRT